MRMRTIKTALAAVFAMVSVTLHADDYVWIGGESGNWSDRNNWSTGTVPGNYTHVTFTNTVTFSTGVMGNQYIYIHLTNDTAVLHLYAGGAHRARHIYISGGGQLHLWEKGCLDLPRSDGEIKATSQSSIFCHGPDVLPPGFYKMYSPELLDLGGFNQTVTNISYFAKGLNEHVITSETPALLSFVGDMAGDSSTYGYIRGKAGICWSPNNPSRKMSLMHYTCDTSGELIVSNGVMEITDGAKFLNLSRTFIGSGATLKVVGTANFKTEHLIMMAGASLDLGTSATPTTCALARVTLVDENGVATDLSQGVYGATAGEGVAACDRIVGNNRFSVTPARTCWKSAQDGDWSTAANWNLGVPNATLGASISEAGDDYTVTISEPATTTNLTVRNWGDGTATLDVASRLEAVKGYWSVGTGGKMMVEENGEVVYYGTKGTVTTKFASATEAFQVCGGGEIEVRGKLAITNMCGSVVLGQNGGSGNITSKVVIAGNGEMLYHFASRYDSYFRLYPGGRIEAKDNGVFRIPAKTESYAWSQQGGSLDFSGHSTLDLGGMWDVCLGQGEAVFRDDAKMVGDGTVGSGTARLYFSSAAGAPTEVWFRDRATYSAGGSGAHTLLRPNGGGRIVLHFDSAATHTFGYLKMGRTLFNGFVDMYISNGLLKVDSNAGFNQGGASISCDANSFTTGHVYQTGGALVVNGESGGYNANFQYGFVLGDGLTSTTVREPTVLGVYELSGGVVTNESIRSPFVLGIGRGRGEFIQTGGDFVSKATASNAPAIFGFSNGYGYYTLSNGTAKISSKIWVGGVNPASCGHAHASYVGMEAVGGITVAAADMSKPCRFEVSDTVVLGGLGEGSLEVGPGGTFAGTSLVLSNNTASALSFRVTDEGFGAVNLSGKLTVTDGASLVIDARGFTGQNFRRCRLMNFASKTGDFAPDKVTVLTDGTTPCYFRISETGLRFGRETGTIISVW